jgi:hypothetical protein
MKTILLNKVLFNNGARNLPPVTLELPLMDLISIYNLCNETVQDYPQMVGYRDLCKKLAPIIEKHNKPNQSC